MIATLVSTMYVSSSDFYLKSAWLGGDLLTACKFHPYHHFWAGIQFFLRKGKVWDELTGRRETREVQPQSNTHMPKRTPNSLSLHTVWLHDLRALPSRGWFYFPAFNGPSAPGARAPPRWRKRETRFFWPLNTSKGSGCPGFLFFHSDGAGKLSWECVGLMSVSRHAGCSLQSRHY